MIKPNRLRVSSLLLGLVGLLVACAKQVNLPVKIDVTERQRLTGFSTRVVDFHALASGQLVAQTTEYQKASDPALLRLGVFDVRQGWDLAFSNVIESKDEVRPRVATFSNPVGTAMVIAREIPLLRDAKEPGQAGDGKISVRRSQVKLEWFDIKARAVVRTDWDGIVEGRYGDTQLRGVQVRLFSDLSYLALVTLVDGSTNLLRFSPAGKLVYAMPLLKNRRIGVFNWPDARLAEGNSDATVVHLSLLKGNRAPFEALHGVSLGGNADDGMEVLLVISPAGKLTAVLPVTEGPDFSPSVLTLQQNRLVVAGERRTADEKSQIVVVLYDVNAGALIKVGSQPFPLTKKQDRVESVTLLPDGRILLTGEAGYHQVKTHSVVEGGEAFLLLLDPPAQTMLGFTKIGNRTRRNSFQRIRLGAAGEIYTDAYLDGPLTHSTDGGKVDRGYSTSVFYEVKLSP